MTAYQPKTGDPCHCRRGQERDNCSVCEGTGQQIDFAAIRTLLGPANGQPSPVTVAKVTHKKNGGRMTCQEQHARALLFPTIAERPLVRLAGALWEYATAHRLRYGAPIGRDGVLGDAWLDVARGFVGLLNGECGRLDCGTLDAEVRQLAKAEGFTAEEVDTL